MALDRQTLYAVFVEISGEFKMIHFEFPDMPSYMPKENGLQLLQQMDICWASLGVYICTREVDLLFNLLVYCNSDRKRFIAEFLDDLPRAYLESAHSASTTISNSTSVEHCQKV